VRLLRTSPRGPPETDAFLGSTGGDQESIPKPPIAPKPVKSADFFLNLTRRQKFFP
jgi:hypothetical protein